MLTRGGKPDILIFAVVMALLSVGLIMVFSASSIMVFPVQRSLPLRAAAVHLAG